MTTILLGGSGFLGPEILRQYPDIVSVGRTRPVTAVHHVDCPDVLQLPRVLDNLEFDKVIMMIGSSNHHQLNVGGLLAIEKNLLPLKLVFDYMRKRKLKKLISFTSILLYDRATMRLPVDETQAISPYQNDYIFSKFLAEQVACYFHDVPNVVARLTNLYGPTTALGRPDVVNQLVEGLILRKKASVMTTVPMRDFIYTVDVAEAVIRLLDSTFTGTVNLATGQMHAVGEVVEILEQLSGLKIERLDGAPTGHLQFCADISRLRSAIGWQPRYDLAAGLSETWRAMEAMYG